jgi:polysaccharide export outer membrane protein
VIFPLLGAIKAAGLTAGELQQELTRLLADGFIKNPQVTVSVAEYLSQRVFVVGEVHTPGVVPLSGNLTLVEALTRAGSLKENAGGELQVIRPAPGSVSLGPTLPGTLGSTIVLRASVQLLLRGQFVTNADLTHGDTIIVPRAESISVLGQVKSPGVVPYEYDMTVLKAVSMVGGPNDVGALGRARIIRIVGGKKTEIKAKETETLQPGDVVMIPMKLW